MKLLTIYDNNGKIYSQLYGDYPIPESDLKFLETEIPEGKTLSRIDTTLITPIPVYEELPPTDIEKVNTQMTAILKGMIV